MLLWHLYEILIRKDLPYAYVRLYKEDHFFYSTVSVIWLFGILIPYFLNSANAFTINSLWIITLPLLDCGFIKKNPCITIPQLSKPDTTIFVYSWCKTPFMLLMICIKSDFTWSISIWRGNLIFKSPLISDSDFNVLIGVEEMVAFGMIVLLLSNVLMTVYLIFISSMVPIIFKLPINCTKSPNLTFWLVMIITQAIMFSIVVSIANPILMEIPHIINAVSNQIIWKIARILKIISKI